MSELDVGHGFLLNSGKSYHFIGTSMVAESALYGLMGRLIMFNPIVDKSWVAHQLVEGYCALRVTEKDGGIPGVIREVDH